MVTLVVQEVADPKIDFDEIMGDSRVADTLAACAAAPGDAECRTAAVAALSRNGVATPDWTEVYGGLGTAVTAAGSSRLDGTVALVRSRSVQVGDRCYQENRMVHTVGPTIGAHALLTDPDIAKALIDVVTQPGDGDAARRLGRTLESGICAELRQSSAVRQNHATVFRPPTAGRTLQVTDAVGVSVGKRVSSKHGSNPPTTAASTAGTRPTDSGRVRETAQRRPRGLTDYPNRANQESGQSLLPGPARRCVARREAPPGHACTPWGLGAAAGRRSTTR
jgi:hypothetical protein